MDTKAAKHKKPAPGYSPEELAPREWAKDDAFVDAYVKRNRVALNASIDRAREAFTRGEGTAVESLDDLHAAIKNRRRAKP